MTKKRLGLVGIGALCAAWIGCVGDEPSTGSSNATDSGVADAPSTSDAANQPDSPSENDAQAPASGSIDPSYANGEEASALFVDFVPRAAVIDSVGRLIVAGSAMNCAAPTSGLDIGLFRFKTDGTLDTGFGPSGTGRACAIFGTGYSEEGYALAIDADGNLVVAGLIDVFSGVEPQLIVARLSGDGVLDNTFGTSGAVISDDPTNSHVGFGIAFDTSNRVLVYGTSGDFTVSSATPVDFLARVTTAGVLDTTFGGGTGIQVLPNNSFGTSFAGVASGDALYISGQGLTKSDFSAAKVHLGGSFDGGFTANPVDVSTHTFSESRSIIVQTNGAFVSAGIATDSFADGITAVVRYGTNGALDVGGWGADAATPGVVLLDTLSWNYAFQLKSLLLDSAQRVLVGGYVATGDPTLKNDLAIIRLATDGTIDSSYGNNGVARTGFAGDEALATLVMEPTSQKIIAVGTGPNNKLTIARFFP